MRYLRYQQLFVIIFLCVILYNTYCYYYPWLITYIEGDFHHNNYMGQNYSYDLLKSERGFSMRFFWNTIRSLASVLLIVVAYKYFVFLGNLKKNQLFTAQNYKLLVNSGFLMLAYSFIIFVISKFDNGLHFMKFGYSVFIGLTLYSFGEVFRMANKYKDENDLTI